MSRRLWVVLSPIPALLWREVPYVGIIDTILKRPLVSQQRKPRQL